MAYTTINKPSSYFTPTLYTGTGSSQSITTVGFKPDWVWIKDRTSANNHREYDIIRGATVELYPNLTDADTTQAQSLTSFNSNGFSLGNLAQVNTNGNNYVSWNWLAANSTTTNTSGTISSTVSVNQTSGFSIVSYTGTGSVANVGHGLGVTPACFITKCRSNAVTSWGMYHQSVGNTAFMELNGTAAKQTNIAYFNNTSPTSSVFTIGTDTINNGNGYTFIAYCFAEVKGFSKFGSYTGNGSSDGTFVYTGFKPAFLLAKSSSTANRQWYIVDNKRSTSDGNNVLNKTLAPNQSNDESWWGTNNYVDFVSNGFKFRDSYDGFNESGGTYIYMAFASSPFVSSKSIPTTAR